MPEIYDEFPWGKSMIENTCIIIGTRPEIIKMSPVMRACERRGSSEWFVVHTGQGCSCDVGRVFFEQLGLPDAKDNLVGITVMGDGDNTYDFMDIPGLLEPLKRSDCAFQDSGHSRERHTRRSERI